jgi:hypothetical protein
MLRSTKTFLNGQRRRRRRRRRETQQRDDKKANLGLFPGQPECLYGPPTNGLLTLASATLSLASAYARHGRTWLWLTGYRVSIWACSHVFRNRHVHVNAPKPGLEAAIAREHYRNEMTEQLLIMLLPMRQHSASADSQ